MVEPIIIKSIKDLFKKPDPDPVFNKGSSGNPFIVQRNGYTRELGTSSGPGNEGYQLGKKFGVEDSWTNILDEDALRTQQLQALYKATETIEEGGTVRTQQGDKIKSIDLSYFTGDEADKKVSFKSATAPSASQKGELKLDIKGFKSLTADDWRATLDKDDPEKEYSQAFKFADLTIKSRNTADQGGPELQTRKEEMPVPEPEPEQDRSDEAFFEIVGAWAQAMYMDNPDMHAALDNIFTTYIDDLTAAWEQGLSPGEAGWPDPTGYPEWSRAKNPNLIYNNLGVGTGTGMGTGMGQGGQQGGQQQDGVKSGIDDSGKFNLNTAMKGNDNASNATSMMAGWEQFADLPKPPWWPDGAPWPPLIPGTPATGGMNATPGTPWTFDNRTYDTMSEALNPQHGLSSAMEMQRLKLAQTRPSTTQSINIPGTNAYLPAIVDGQGNITQMDMPNLESQIDRAIIAGDVSTVRSLMGVRDMPSPVEKLNLALQVARTPADMFQISRLAGGESMDRFGDMAPFLSQAVQDVFAPTDPLSGLQPMGSRAGMLQSYPQQGMGGGTPSQDIRSTLTQGDERFGGGGFAVDPEMEAFKRANAGYPQQDHTAPPISQALKVNTGPNDVAQSAMAQAASSRGYYDLANQFSGASRNYGPDPEKEFTTIGQNAGFTGYGGAGGMSPRVGNVMLEGDPLARPSSLFSPLGLRVPSMQATQNWLPEERIQAEEYVRGLGIDPARLWDEVKVGTPGGGTKPGIRWKESFLD